MRLSTAKIFKVVRTIGLAAIAPAIIAGRCYGEDLGNTFELLGREYRERITDPRDLRRPSYGSSINNQGIVAGTIYGRAYLFRAPESLQLDFFGDAADINDNNVAVGRRDLFFPPSRAFVFDPNAGYNLLGSLGGSSQIISLSQAAAVNEYGHVVGSALVNDVRVHAFLWDREKGMTDLGTLGGEGSSATDINNENQVVGWAYAIGAGGWEIPGAFVYDAEHGMQALEGLSRDQSSEARAINDKGRIVGYSTLAAVPRRCPLMRATVWDAESKKIQLLNELGDGESMALNINENGDIVGFFRSSKNDPNQLRGFFQPAGGEAVDLNCLVPKEVHIDAATDINEHREITGTAYQETYYPYYLKIRNISAWVSCPVISVTTVCSSEIKAQAANVREKRACKRYPKKSKRRARCLRRTRPTPLPPLHGSVDTQTPPEQSPRPPICEVRIGVVDPASGSGIPHLNLEVETRAAEDRIDVWKPYLAAASDESGRASIPLEAAHLGDYLRVIAKFDDSSHLRTMVKSGKIGDTVIRAP